MYLKFLAVLIYEGWQRLNVSKENWKILLTTTENVPGKNCEIIGQGLKSIVGGEMETYVVTMNEACVIATQRMVEETEGFHADAIVCVRYATSVVTADVAENIAFRTAVRYV